MPPNIRKLGITMKNCDDYFLLQSPPKNKIKGPENRFFINLDGSLLLRIEFNLPKKSMQLQPNVKLNIKLRTSDGSLEYITN